MTLAASVTGQTKCLLKYLAADLEFDCAELKFCTTYIIKITSGFKIAKKNLEHATRDSGNFMNSTFHHCVSKKRTVISYRLSHINPVHATELYTYI